MKSHGLIPCQPTVLFAGHVASLTSYGYTDESSERLDCTFLIPPEAVRQILYRLTD